MIEPPPWNDDKLFKNWINQMLDAEMELYDELESVPDLMVIQDGAQELVDVKAAFVAAENLDYEPLASLLDRGISPPFLLKWIGVQLRTGGFKARTPASKKIANAAWVLDNMRRLCSKHYGRRVRRKPLKSLITFAADRCQIDERSLRKQLKGR